MNTLTEKDFLNAGYRSSFPHLKPRARRLLQKKVMDEIGVKYFITVYVWDSISGDGTLKFEPDLQFQYKNGVVVDIQLLLRGHETIDEIEVMVQYYWEVSGSVYYEEFQ